MLLLRAHFCVTCMATDTPSAAQCVSFHPVTCNTFAPPSSFDLCGQRNHGGLCEEPWASLRTTNLVPTVNVCQSRKWRGFGWKLGMFARYAALLNEVHTAGTGCAVVLLLLDGEDTFFNLHLNLTVLEQRWRAARADILVSTEQTCWVGDVCAAADLDEYYPNVNVSMSTVSPYANSGMMGDVRALSRVLGALLHQHAYQDYFNDQKAVALLASGRVNGPFTVQRDVRQSIFGSMAFPLPFGGGCDKRATHRFTCFDLEARRHLIRGCCIQGSPFRVSASCDIERVPALDAPWPDHKSTYASVSVATLEPHPILWHGNGVSRPIYNQLTQQARDCRQQRSQMLMAKAFELEHKRAYPRTADRGCRSVAMGPNFSLSCGDSPLTAGSTSSGDSFGCEMLCLRRPHCHYASYWLTGGRGWCRTTETCNLQVASANTIQVKECGPRITDRGCRVVPTNDNFSLFCADSELMAGETASGSAASCERLCAREPRCRYASYWLTGGKGWCRTTETCNLLQIDSTNIIQVKECAAGRDQ